MSSPDKCALGVGAGLGKRSLTRQGGVQGTGGGGGHGGVTEQPAEYRGTESLVGPGKVRLGQPQGLMGHFCLPSFQTSPLLHTDPTSNPCQPIKPLLRV